MLSLAHPKIIVADTMNVVKRIRGLDSVTIEVLFIELGALLDIFSVLLQDILEYNQFKKYSLFSFNTVFFSRTLSFLWTEWGR